MNEEKISNELLDNEKLETAAEENNVNSQPQYIPPPQQYAYQYPYPSQKPYQPFVYKRKEQDDILEHTAARMTPFVVLFSWLFGLVFSDAFLRGGMGISIPISTVLFYLIAFWYLSGKEIKIKTSALVLLIPIGIISASFLYSDSGMTHFINLLVLLVLIPVQLSRMSNTAAGSVFSLQSAIHTLVSCVARPLSYLDTPFRAIARHKEKESKGSKLAMVIIGLIIALPIATIFISLFNGADSTFKYFVDELLKHITISFDSLFFDIFFGTLIAMFLSALFITLRARKAPENNDVVVKQNMDSTLISTVLVVINIIQMAFVSIQFGYLFAGERAKLPNDMTPSQYARSGFFELCGVISFTVLIIMICMIFSRKTENKKMHPAVATLLTLLIACNYVIIASAIYRMNIYIQDADLTIKRVMVLWLILVFGISLFGAVIKIWVPKFKTSTYVAIAVVVMTIAINVVNVNAFVAKYNVDSYIESVKTQKDPEKVRRINVEYLELLGPSAAEQTAKLLEYDAVKQKAFDALTRQYNILQSKRWGSFSISDVKAAEVFKNNKIDGYYSDGFNARGVNRKGIDRNGIDASGNNFYGDNS